MAYVDADYLRGVLSPELVDGLFRDSGVVNEDARDDVIALANARVRRGLKKTGYTPPSDATITAWLAGDETQVAEADAIRLAVVGAFLKLAALRKQRKLPPEASTALSALKDIEEGRIEFDGLSFSERDGIGGLKFSSSDSSVDGSRPQLFPRGMGR